MRCLANLSRSKRNIMICLVAQLVFITGCGLHSEVPAISGEVSTPGFALTTSAEHRVHLSGWLHIIWNGEPRFVLIDDQGTATHVVIDETVAKTFGGPRKLNQKRVIITGERMDEPIETIRVLSIEMGKDGK